MLTYTKTGDNGSKTTYYSHSSFLSRNQRDAIQSCYSKASGYAKFTAGSLALGLFIGTHKVPVLAGLTKKVHPVALTAGVFFLTFWGLKKVFLPMQSSNISSIIQSEGAIPLWKNNNCVINLDRAFFSLDDTRNNQPNILHDGLSLEAIDRLYPDLILGKAPTEKPHYPAAHHDHH